AATAHACSCPSRSSRTRTASLADQANGFRQPCRKDTHIDERLDGEIGTAQELTTTDRGHGREEQRTYLQLPAPEGLPGKAEWKGLKSVGVVTSRRKEGQEESIQVRYYLSSLPVDLKLFARAVRGHWSVENG